MVFIYDLTLHVNLQMKQNETTVTTQKSSLTTGQIPTGILDVQGSCSGNRWLLKDHLQ